MFCAGSQTGPDVVIYQFSKHLTDQNQRHYTSSYTSHNNEMMYMIHVCLHVHDTLNLDVIVIVLLYRALIMRRSHIETKATISYQYCSVTTVFDAKR